MGPDHRRVVLGPYVWKPDPQGACVLGLPGGPRPPSHRGGGPVPPCAPEEAAAKPAPPRVWWEPVFYEKPAQLPH
jgi:hypothetical protein